MAEDHSLAVLIDFENLALGMERHSGRPATGRGSRTKKANGASGLFDVKLVLERLVEKGKVIVKRAYADWGRFAQYREVMHESGIQMMEIPERGMTGKNHADIQLCVDAMDMCYSKEHIDTFVIVSGDSDFTPLVAKLKENGKSVIGLGIKDSTSDLLASSCDEFIYYEDVVRGPATPAVPVATIPKAKRPAMQLMIESVQALQRENKDVILASMVKDTMRRKQPQFSESSYGYRSFSDFLHDAERLGIITLRTDQRSGTWVVSGFVEKR